MTKDDILKEGTKTYCSLEHSIKMYGQGDSPFNDVIATAKSAMDEWAKQQGISFAQWIRRKIYYNIGIGDFLWKESDEVAPEIDIAFDIFQSETSKP